MQINPRSMPLTIYRDLVNSFRGSGSKINLLERLVEQAMNTVSSKVWGKKSSTLDILFIPGFHS